MCACVREHRACGGQRSPILLELPDEVCLSAVPRLQPVFAVLNYSRIMGVSREPAYKYVQHMESILELIIDVEISNVSIWVLVIW